MNDLDLDIGQGCRLSPRPALRNTVYHHWTAADCRRSYSSVLPRHHRTGYTESILTTHPIRRPLQQPRSNTHNVHGIKTLQDVQPHLHLHKNIGLNVSVGQCTQ